MPITNWFCPSCKRIVPLDHFATTACGAAVHPDYAAAVLLDNGKDRSGVHVTSLLGCPRKGRLEGMADVTVDPLSYNAMLGGTAWHSLMEKGSAQPELCEVAVAGTINGVEVVGRIDRLFPPLIIDDWKTSSDFAEKWIRAEGIKPEHIAQLSLYAELVEQQFSYRPTTGRIWYRFQKSIVPLSTTLWTTDQVLAFAPHGGDYTVAELLAQSASTVPWQLLPLAGKTQYFGKSAKNMCDYCAVKDTCWTEDAGAGF